MELKYLQTFKTILHAGSFQKAAEQLGYAQSTVTFQIQQLENEFSVQLFEKIGRKMVLTQTGRELLPYIDHILDGFEQLENHGKNNSELKGELKVALPETMLLYQIQPVLKKFRTLAPNVKLTISMPNSTAIYDMVLNGQCDLGFHYHTGSYSSSVVVQHLCYYPMLLVGSPQLSDAEQDYMTAGTRKISSLLIGDKNSMLTRTFHDYLARKNITVEHTIFINSIEAIKRSAASDIGVAFLPYFVVKDYLDNGMLQELETDTKFTIDAVYLYHKNKWITPAMELFMNLAKELLV